MHVVRLREDGLHGVQVGLEVLIGGAAFVVSGVVVAVPLEPSLPVLGSTGFGGVLASFPLRYDGRLTCQASSRPIYAVGGRFASCASTAS